MRTHEPLIAPRIPRAPTATPSRVVPPRAAAVLALQRSVGNRAVVGALREEATSGSEAVGDAAVCTDGPTLACTAKASRTSSTSISVGTPKENKASDDTVTYTARGKLTATYATTVAISMAPAPTGLSACATKKYAAMLKELETHEKDHKARFTTTDPARAYDGTVVTEASETGSDAAAVQQTVKDRLAALVTPQESARKERNDAYAIAAIDPFTRTVDLSDCPECKPPAPAPDAAPEAPEDSGSAEE
ncbi:MAG: hypothetical protein JWM64_43 [Frankiales bacterium]|nr:hypothetical protein [Frankiales bacterium]